MSRLAERIASAPLKRIPADCPEWNELAGETLYIREMTALERENWESSLAKGMKRRDGKNFDADLSIVPKLRRELVASCLVDSKGEPVFESEQELQGRSGDVVGRLGAQVMELSGMGGAEEAEEEAGN